MDQTTKNQSIENFIFRIVAQGFIGSLQRVWYMYMLGKVMGKGFYIDSHNDIIFRMGNLFSLKNCKKNVLSATKVFFVHLMYLK